MRNHYGPPMDLGDMADYARTLRPACKVFIGRVSTKDNQNPATSIPRQVALASDCLDQGEEFAAYFWDVESGMLPPELRSLQPQAMYDALHVPVPRDGGLQDLVDRAEQLGVTHALAERSDRLARAMLTSLTVEHELTRMGVEVIYANEPTGGTKSGQLRMRRYGQVEAEVYRHAMIEMSTGGQVQHAVQGWNHGYAPYPYVRVLDTNAPVRGRGRFGDPRPKHKLAPHPDTRRFATAREIHRLRRDKHLRASEIIAILAADPERYPVDGEWTFNRVEGLLANPKLTGYQVYNRKANRTGRPGSSRLNPIVDWVWSPNVAHKPVVTVAEWKQSQEVTSWLRLGTNDGPALLRIAEAARMRGLDVTTGESSGTHTTYMIGEQVVVLPHPVPDAAVRRIIADLEGKR